jgi:hypothetical protein
MSIEELDCCTIEEELFCMDFKRQFIIAKSIILPAVLFIIDVRQKENLDNKTTTNNNIKTTYDTAIESIRLQTTLLLRHRSMVDRKTQCHPKSHQAASLAHFYRILLRVFLKTEQVITKTMK